MKTFVSLRLALLMLCLLVNSIHAEKADYADGSGPSSNSPPPASAQGGTDEQRKAVVRGFRNASGERIPEGSVCEKILINAQIKGGLVFNFKAIEDVLPAILKQTGETLQAPALNAPKTSSATNYGSAGMSTWNCFTHTMRVWTPHGLVEIGRLEEGDEVYSLDLENQTVVSNRIQQIIRSVGKPVLLTDLAQPLEVTEEERFLTANKDYVALKDLNSKSLLQRALIQGQRFELRGTPRGNIQRPGIEKPVFNLILDDEPRNFIIEEIVVHNVKC